MSAELSFFDKNAEMMYNGPVPWHGFGTRVEGLATAKEAIAAAHLDWPVYKAPLYMSDSPADPVEGKDEPHPAIRVPGFATFRRDEHGLRSPLGVVGAGYEVVQNTDLFGFFDELIGPNAAVYHTAGALRGGRIVWLLAELNLKSEIPGDPVIPFLLLRSSHDGSGSIIVSPTPVRVVCANTLSMALRGATTVVSIRHTKGAPDRLRAAGLIMKAAQEYYTKVFSAMQLMTRLRITDAQAEQYFRTVAGLNTDEAEEWGPRKLQLAEDKISAWMEARESPDFGMSLDTARGTLWGAVNAVTLCADHFTTTRVELPESIWFGALSEQKRTALDVAVQLVGAN